MSRLIVACLFFFGSTQGFAASSPACSSKDLAPLYKSAIDSICSINYVWNLVEPDFATKEDRGLCAGTYAGLLGLAGGMGLSTLAMRETGLSTMRRMPNTPAMHAELDSLMGKFPQKLMALDAKNILNANPKNSVMVSIASDANGPIIRKGTSEATEMALRGAEMVSKSAIAVAALSTVLLAADFFFNPIGGIATGCDEQKFAYVGIDANCEMVSQLHPNVLSFLNASASEQDQALTTFPDLCDQYRKIAQTVDANLKTNFSVTAKTEKCEAGRRTLSLSPGGGTAVVEGNNVQIKQNGSTYSVNYEPGSNFEHLDSISATIVTMSPKGGATQKYVYRRPFDKRAEPSREFQTTLGSVGRLHNALSRAQAFAPCNPLGESTLRPGLPANSTN